MSIVESLKELASGLGLSFMYATEDEANVLMDRFNRLEFPAIVVLPIVVDDVNSHGQIKSTFDMAFYTLTKVDAPTNEITREALEPTIEAMRLKARKFIHAIDGSTLIDGASNGIEKAKHTAAYGVLDAHAHGVFTQCNVPIIETTTLC